MNSPDQWLHAKHDCLLPRFLAPVDGGPVLGLPSTRKQPKAVVRAAFDGVQWWCNGHCWMPPQDRTEFEALRGARIVVNTTQERLALNVLLGEDIELVVLDEWFEDAPKTDGLNDRVAQLLARMEHCQNVLRVDFREHRSILSAWKWRNLRRIGKSWTGELQSTHQWLQSLDDRPWQEARMAYDLRSLAGAVLDIRSAYASAVEAMAFPEPGVAWKALRAGQRHTDALHCVVWSPTDAIGRFYHPFWYTVQGVRAQPGYKDGDHVHVWVLDEDIPWLERHGTVVGVYQTVAPNSMQPHPLSGSVSAWRQLLAEETVAGYRGLHKMRLVSSHSWTWQPKKTMLVADARTLAVHALEEYSSRIGARIGGLHISEDPELGLIAQGNAASESGWYTPIAWVRLKLRSHLMRRVEHALEHGLDIAYVSVDGMHVRGSTQEQIEACHTSFEDVLAPWWKWRVDKTFAKGIWFRPGSYALQDEHGQWIATNLPDNITGRDWNLWCQARGTLDARKSVGYWRRPNTPQTWQKYPSIAVNAQRHFRSIVRRELQR